MAKIFAAQAELNNHPSRNNFDLSHKIHMSGKMGLLYPVYCKPVVPGDSFRIDSGCAFNFMPMPYPTQTRMRFIMHFFYVRNKNLWKNWENWLEGLPANSTGETPVPPYIDQPVGFYKTGTLADFLGIPTTVKSLSPSVALQPASPMELSTEESKYRLYGFASNAEEGLPEGEAAGQYPALSGLVREGVWDVHSRYLLHTQVTRSVEPCASATASLAGESDNWGVQGRSALTRVYQVPMTSPKTLDDGSVPIVLSNPVYVNAGDAQKVTVCLWCRMNDDDTGHHLVYKFSVPVTPGSFVNEVTLPSGFIERIKELRDDYPQCSLKMSVSGFYGGATVSWLNCSNGPVAGRWPVDFVDSQELDEVEGANPYYSSTNTDTDTVRVSALPFRAYESIYNAFYRNTNGNQPFMIDGRIQYNKYNTTTEDGADTTDYKLFHRNWELDAYTSCLPSPQQGAAPVVGISALGEVTIVDPETGVTTTARATDTPNGMQISDVNLGDQTHQQYLINLATSGITINDFRNVNALQRFLETNIRKGYRYMDFIEGHFGVKIKGAILDMPEFIGGFNQSVDVNMISNMTAGEKNGLETLGDYGGQASAFGGSKHSISHFCDDYGFIVGILCLVPEPTYSQILPKHFNVKQPLDYYFPEFSQIGLQPLTYEELCPVQSHLEHQSDPNKKLTDVFGYQRPNHDLVWHPDTLHGEFRKTFSRYIINRMYTQRPELGNEFLTIKPEETNTIFNYTAPDEDVFLGQIAFNVQAKRPIPRIVIPSLGR